MTFDNIWGWLKGLLAGAPKGKPDTRERSAVPPRSKTRVAGKRTRPNSLPSEVTPSTTSHALESSPQERRRIVPDKSQSPSEQKKLAPRQTTDLIIGLDFGTAATKVVVRSPYLPGQRARAISFEQLGHRSSPYLLPTRLHVADDGSLHLGGNVPGVWQTNLKVALLDRSKYKDGTNQNADPLCIAAAYLALVLREARERYLRAEQDIYRRFEIRWAANMGIPSSGYNDQIIREDFLLAARLAWHLSWEEGPIDLNHLAARLHRMREQTTDTDLPVAVVPEVVAQAVGYARSPLRDTGLHLLVDVGASTLDVCGFVLRPAEGQDCYDLLTATVDRLGVLELHQQRLDALRCERGRKQFEDFDPLGPLPEVLAAYHPGCSCGATDIDAEFRAKVAHVITRHLATLKKRRDPYSQKWNTGLPLFLCGGGGMMGFFREAAGQADREFRKAMIAEPAKLRTLPKPTGLVNQDIDESLFHRLSVAYGLSFDAFNIGSVTPPDELEDIKVEADRRDYEKDYISKDEV